MKRDISKQVLQLLRYLQTVETATIAPMKNCETETSLLQSTKGPKLLVSKKVLQMLSRAALVDFDTSTYRLSKLGQNKLSRMQQRDNAFGGQHRDIKVQNIESAGSKHLVSVNVNESPLTRLRHRKGPRGETWLDDGHVEAGNRLRSDFTRGQLMQKVTSSWDPTASSGKSSGRGLKADLTDSALDARKRLETALQTVGPDLAGVLTDVCCFLKGLELVERERRWPPRSAKLMLRTGLELLCFHYGLRTQR